MAITESNNLMDDEAMLVKLRFYLSCHPAVIQLEYPVAVHLWRLCDSPEVPFPPLQQYTSLSPKRAWKLLEMAERNVFGENRKKVFFKPH